MSNKSHKCLINCHKIISTFKNTLKKSNLKFSQKSLKLGNLIKKCKN